MVIIKGLYRDISTYFGRWAVREREKTWTGQNEKVLGCWHALIIWHFMRREAAAGWSICSVVDERQEMDGRAFLKVDGSRLDIERRSRSTNSMSSPERQCLADSFVPLEKRSSVVGFLDHFDNRFYGIFFDNSFVAFWWRRVGELFNIPAGSETLSNRNVFVVRIVTRRRMLGICRSWPFSSGRAGQILKARIVVHSLPMSGPVHRSIYSLLIEINPFVA